jgi:hypothetical protein
MIHVCSSPIVTSGWKLAGGVEVELGQTTTVDSARRSSAWTITAKRRPCWTRPRPRGSLISWTSPRTTKLFHHGCDLASFPHIGRVLREGRCFRSQASAPPFAVGCLSDRLARRLRSADASPSSDLVKRAQAVAAKSKRQRRCWGSHAGSVVQIALQDGSKTHPSFARALTPVTSWFGPQPQYFDSKRSQFADFAVSAAVSTGCTGNKGRDSANEGRR